MVPEPPKASKKTRDPHDDAILQAALDAGCDWLLSGDKDLTSLGKAGKMRIATPRSFLEAAEKE